MTKARYSALVPLTSFMDHKESQTGLTTVEIVDTTLILSFTLKLSLLFYYNSINSSVTGNVRKLRFQPGSGPTCSERRSRRKLNCRRSDSRMTKRRTTNKRDVSSRRKDRRLFTTTLYYASFGESIAHV